MDPFEYVVVLTSLILGLGVAQILTSVADILSNLKNVKLSLPHGLLVVVVFLLHIQEWWINYQYSKEVEQWTLLIVLSILIYPIFLFILARMLFPTGIRGHETDLDSYYFDQWHWFYGIGLGTMIISTWQNSLIQDLPISSSWPQMSFGIIYILFLVFKIRNKWCHLALQLISLIGLVSYIAIDDTSLVFSQP